MHITNAYGLTCVMVKEIEKLVDLVEWDGLEITHDFIEEPSNNKSGIEEDGEEQYSGSAAPPHMLDINEPMDVLKEHLDTPIYKNVDGLDTVEDIYREWLRAGFDQEYLD